MSQDRTPKAQNPKTKAEETSAKEALNVRRDTMQNRRKYL